MPRFLHSRSRHSLHLNMKKKKNIKWKNHIAMAELLAFRPHEKKLVKKLFEMDLDYEISKAKKSHWIEVKTKWRNTGSKPKENA